MLDNEGRILERFDGTDFSVAYASFCPRHWQAGARATDAQRELDFDLTLGLSSYRLGRQEKQRGKDACRCFVTT